MHIPNEMLSGPVCPLTAGAAAIGVGVAAWAAVRQRRQLPSAGQFAAVSGLLFAGQMLNFPVQAGTSGHLLGGVLAAALLGTPLGVLAVALVLTVQCLVFADGDLTALGANILNMAVIGAGLGGLLLDRLGLRQNPRQPARLATVGAVAWLSVVLAAFACCLQLALGGTAAFAVVAPSMLGVHALIGLGEAGLTVAAVSAVNPATVAAAPGRKPLYVGAAALLMAVVLSPFASPWPDGLEWVAERYGFLKDSAPTFVGFIPDYALPGIANEALATSAAGLIGTLLTFIIALLLCRPLAHRHTAPATE